MKMEFEITDRLSLEYNEDNSAKQFDLVTKDGEIQIVTRINQDDFHKFGAAINAIQQRIMFVQEHKMQVMPNELSRPIRPNRMNV